MNLPPNLKPAEKGDDSKMQIQHLVYCGNREEGTLRVNRVDVLSEWRHIKYYKGLRFQVGKIIPLDVASIVAKDYPSLFKMETKEVEDKEAYILRISDTVEECLAVMGDEGALEVVSEIVKDNFEGYEVAKIKAPKKTVRRRKK